MQLAALVLIALSLATSCAAGFSDGSGAVAGTEANDTECGNGRLETGEECEIGQPMQTTCSALGMGTGEIICNNACRLSMMCSGMTGGGGGGTTGSQ